MEHPVWARNARDVIGRRLGGRTNIGGELAGKIASSNANNWDIGLLKAIRTQCHRVLGNYANSIARLVLQTIIEYFKPDR